MDNFHRICPHAHTHIHTNTYLWFNFSSITPQSRHLCIHQQSFYSHPNPLRIPVLTHSMQLWQAVQQNTSPAPGKRLRPGQTDGLLWEPDSWHLSDPRTCMAASFQWHHPEETVISATKTSRATPLLFSFPFGLCDLFPIIFNPFLLQKQRLILREDN